MFARELLCECVQEAMPLLAIHHRECMPHSDVIPLDPRWADYALLERLGRYLIFTARDEGRLKGYSAFYLDRHMHSGEFLRAQNDVFFVVPESRGGTIGLSFLRYCHKQLKAEGARHIAYHDPKGMLAPLLERMGYVDEERVIGCMT